MTRTRQYSSPVCYADEAKGPQSQRPRIRIKRVYEPPARGDGARVLVDRLWPRGVAKERARLEFWARDLAPSTELRKWFGHSPTRWREFRRRYLIELRDHAGDLAALKLRSTKRPLTLLYAARNTENNHAMVLAEAIGNAQLPADS